MPASFSVNGSNTTIDMTFTAPTAKIQATFEIVCRFGWSSGYGPRDATGEQVPYVSLTNQQKLNIFYDYIVRQVKQILINNQRNLDAVTEQAAADSVFAVT